MLNFSRCDRTNEQRLRYSIGISVGYADWDFERQRVRRNRSLIINSATVNRYLDKLQNELIRDHSELVLEGKKSIMKF